MNQRVLRVLRTVWMLGGLGFLLWLAVGFQSVDIPTGTFQSSDTVRVEEREGGGWTFTPVSASGPKALVFLPGGMVDPQAYGPLVRAVAEQGNRAILLPIPWRSAYTQTQRQNLFAEIRAVSRQSPVVLAGHSRGAMLAATYAHAERDGLAALVLIATTHPRDFSLADLTIPVTKVYGTNDGVAGVADIKKNAPLLPAHTEWIAIEGGNHVQFAHYRHQLMAGTSTISREEQQRQTVDALVRVLRR